MVISPPLVFCLSLSQSLRDSYHQLTNMSLEFYNKTSGCLFLNSPQADTSTTTFSVKITKDLFKHVVTSLSLCPLFSLSSTGRRLLAPSPLEARSPLTSHDIPRPWFSPPSLLIPLPPLSSSPSSRQTVTVPSAQAPSWTPFSSLLQHPCSVRMFAPNLQFVSPSLTLPRVPYGRSHRLTQPAMSLQSALTIATIYSQQSLPYNCQSDQ